MKDSPIRRGLYRSAVLGVLIVSVAALCFGRTTSGSIKIINNSSREVRNVYFSHADSDDWGADQLGDNSISAGGSYTIAVNWDQPQVKVIAEDQEGCFLSTVVASGDSSTWTITNDTARDCGGSY